MNHLPSFFSGFGSFTTPKILCHFGIQLVSRQMLKRCLIQQTFPSTRIIVSIRQHLYRTCSSQAVIVWFLLQFTVNMAIWRPFQKINPCPNYVYKHGAGTTPNASNTPALIGNNNCSPLPFRVFVHVFSTTNVLSPSCIVLLQSDLFVCQFSSLPYLLSYSFAPEIRHCTCEVVRSSSTAATTNSRTMGRQKRSQITEE